MGPNFIRSPAPPPTGHGRAGVPGLEPRLTEPESVGLPITPYPIGAAGRAASELYPSPWCPPNRPDAWRFGGQRNRSAFAAAHCANVVPGRPVRSVTVVVTCCGWPAIP